MVWRGMVLRGVSVCLCLFFSSAAVVVARDGRHTCQPHHHMIAAAAAAGAAAVVVMVSGRDRVDMRRRCVFVCVVGVFCMVCRGVLWVVGRV